MKDINIYSVIGLLVAVGVWSHLASKEENLLGMVAGVAIVYAVMR